MADALSSNLNLFNTLSTASSGLFGKTTTRRTSGGAETKQTMLSQEAIDNILRGLMEDERGLSRVASGARIPGLYNTTSQQLMINDLISRSAGIAAEKSAPTVTTKTPTVEETEIPGMGTGGLLSMGAMVLGSSGARKKLGLDFDFGSIFGGGGGGDVGLPGISGPEFVSGGMDSIMPSSAGGGASPFSFMSTPIGGSGVTVANALPYLPAVSQLFQGDVEGAAKTGAGTYVGSAIGNMILPGIGGPIGGAIGSAIGGGCFITTAICKTLGLPDDCYELQTLRKFRDTWFTENNPDDIKQYYAEAPAIVAAIDSNAQSTHIYKVFNRDYIHPAIVAIEQGRNEDAYNIYKRLFLKAKEIANAN